MNARFLSVSCDQPGIPLHTDWASSITRLLP